ncbi:hypothetical protein J502_0517 [Acinetobacter sp. 1294596]|nr:hypothetical protein ACINWCA157_0104 [Acinetobacter radioresistens WC-A-157]EXF58328.1 hypothetical protein J502_0517 [Acinetobacter sp. 1294596]
MLNQETLTSSYPQELNPLSKYEYTQLTLYMIVLGIFISIFLYTCSALGYFHMT